MLLLIIFAFLAGVVTILSPCILPILPIVLAGSVGGSKKKPMGVVTGFVLSFTFFTLFLSAIVRATGLSADLLRIFSVAVILILGIGLLLPQMQLVIEKMFAGLAGLLPQNKSGQTGFGGGLVIGLSLGLLWTPCVGPILAAVISLAVSGSVSSQATLITLAYAAGTAGPMLAIMYGGRQLLQKVPWLLTNSAVVQKVFGVVMILTAIGIHFNLDRKFQTHVLKIFPEYGVGLTKLEDNNLVNQLLNNLNAEPGDKNQIGKPMADVMEGSFQIAPELIEGGQWFNSNALRLAELKGRVVLVDFWTYTCINCIRTLPYLKAWDEKYRDKGLVIIGVHSPEFEFEKNPENLQKAIDDYDLKYPIMQDNDFATWKAYRNRYWPAKYLVDKNGKIRYTHFGEGDYDQTEAKIQELLREAGSQVGESMVENLDYETRARTPELYLGYDRMEYFDSNTEPRLNIVTNYALKDMQPKRHHFGFVGDWTIGRERSIPTKGAALQLNFDASQVYLVMRAIDKSKPARVWFRLDGGSEGLGKDVKVSNSGQEIVEVEEDRLYHLVDLEKPGNNFVGLEFIDGNVEVYAFTFG